MFSETLCFDQVNVVSGIIRQAKRRTMLEAFDEQTESIQRSESFRPEDFG